MSRSWYEQRRPDGRADEADRLVSVRTTMSQRQLDDCAGESFSATVGQRQLNGCADTTDPPTNQTAMCRSDRSGSRRTDFFAYATGGTRRRRVSVADRSVTARRSPIRPTTSRSGWRRSGSVRMTTDRRPVVQRRPDGRAGGAERPALGP